MGCLKGVRRAYWERFWSPDVASNDCFILRLPSPSWFSWSTLAKQTQDDDISLQDRLHEAIRIGGMATLCIIEAWFFDRIRLNVL